MVGPRLKSTTFYPRSSVFGSNKLEIKVEKLVYSHKDFNEKTIGTRAFWKILYISKGYGKKIINGNRYPMRRNSIFLIHPQDQTSFIIESADIEIYHVLFMPHSIKLYLESMADDYDFFSIFNPGFYNLTTQQEREQLYITDSNRKISGLFTLMMAEQVENQHFHDSMLKLRLSEMLLLIARQSISKSKSRSLSNTVAYINHVIDQHYDNELSLDVLAQQLGFNKSYLCRSYKKAQGISIIKKLLNRRMEKAKWLLQESDKNISEICYDCGFNDLSFFYRKFRESYGNPPNYYRK